MKAVILIVVVSVCVSGAKRICEPGSKFLSSDGCNRCVCSLDGQRAGCTKMACAKPRVKRDQVCAPGETFKDQDGCNTCTCSKNGKFSACTKRACVKDIPNRSERCTAGESYIHDDGCNRCTCGPTGNKSLSACTMMLCPPKPLI